jgi:hypothetical protein
METTTFSANDIRRGPVASGEDLADLLSSETRFADLPIPARVLLAVTRIRRPAKELSLAERYVLDSLGRTIDAGPHRAETISAVSRFAESLIKPHSLSALNVYPKTDDAQWLTSVENFALCVLCQVRAGKGEEANQLLGQWLGESSIQQFNTAAKVLCRTECFKRGGPHVFTPAWTGTDDNNDADSSNLRSVVNTADLSLNESIILNAFRLRARTLNFPNIATKVLPLLCEQLALPRLEAIIDGYMVEVLRHFDLRSAIKCTCCRVVSHVEARLLSGVAAHCSGDQALLEQQLQSWMIGQSAERLCKRRDEFQSIAQALNFSLPMRDWDWSELEELRDENRLCSHAQEPSMVG